MGNTPAQRPFEDGDPEGAESARGTSLTARVVRAARSFLVTCRRRLTVTSSRSERSPRDTVERGVVDDESAGETSETVPAVRNDAVEYRSVDDIPRRDTPFAYPASNCDDENGPDLQATESDDRLAIYYPNCPGATIESDTWERVER